MPGAILILVGLTMAAPAVADDFPVMVYPAPKADRPPVLDGSLSDPCWRTAPVASGFTVLSKPRPANVETSFHVTYDEQSLYVGVVCEEPLAQLLKKSQPGFRDDPAAFREECIEVFIDPLHAHCNHYQVAVSLQETIFDGRGQDAGRPWKWNSHTRVATRLGQKGWSLEVAIPWADLGLKQVRPGMVVGFNICRDRTIGKGEWTSWSRMIGSFHNAPLFGHLVLSPTPKMLKALTADFRKGRRQGPIRILNSIGARTSPAYSASHKRIPRRKEKREQKWPMDALHKAIDALPLTLQLERYLLLGRERELHGTLTVRMDSALCRRLCAANVKAVAFRVRATDIAGGRIRWQKDLPMQEPQLTSEYPFTLPVGDMPGGYYRLQVAVVAPGGVARWEPGPDLKHGRDNRRHVVFAIAEPRKGRARPLPADPFKRYLSFVTDTVEKLYMHQSARLGGKPDGTLFLTVTNPIGRGYRSLGERRGNSFVTHVFPDEPFDLKTFRMDMESWPILDRLSELAGLPRYRDSVTAMAGAFARCGFDDRTGLGYLGEEADFDVVRVSPQGKGCFGKGKEPRFKPNNSGNCPALPLDRLWAHAPQRTARMMRAMYYGLVTDGATMSYNRFCRYSFAYADRKPAMKPSSGHCAFESVGARMIHWWSSCFAHTGDAECLKWAQAMADKWQAVQRPESGLAPYYFGGVSGRGATQPPAEFASVTGSSMAATALIQAAGELKKRPGGRPLAGQLTVMGTKLAKGVGRFGYDADRRLFHHFLHLDGRPYSRTARYTFRTQQEKDEAVKKDPLLKDVPVFDGVGFYRNGPYWRYCAGSDMPCQLALAAARTGDAELLQGVRRIAEAAVEESRKLTGTLTNEGLWTFEATGRYIKTLVLLFRTTKEKRYLEWARELADREILALQQVACPDWWRMRERHALLEGLLMLCSEMKAR